MFLSRIAVVQPGVQCYTTFNCSGSFSPMATGEDCCVGNPEGLAYSVAGREECLVCFGKYIMPSDHQN